MESSACIELISDKQHGMSAYEHTRHDVISSGNDPLRIVFIMRRVCRIIVIKSCKTRDRLVTQTNCCYAEDRLHRTAE